MMIWNLLLAGSLAASAALASSPQDPLPGTRRALLIGVNDYKQPVVPDLRGCVNDVRRLERVLRTQYGFEKIETLTDSEATRSAILAGLERAVRETKRGDFLFIHYSGHGSQQPDQNGDEQEDGLDETLVAHDSRTDGVPDIVDDQLDAILANLKTSDVVVSFDACHSGTGTRDLAALATRDVPPDARRELYADLKRPSRLAGEVKYLVITSALAEEQALDARVQGIPHGLFSLALARALEGQGPASRSAKDAGGVEAVERAAFDGYSEIVEMLGCAYRASTPAFELVGYDKEPVAERRRRLGQLLPRPREGRGARRAWLQAKLSASRVVLEDADALGGAVGSSWVFFADGETEFTTGALGWGTVTSLAGGRATVEPNGDLVERLQSAHAGGFRAVRLAAPGAGDTVVKFELSTDLQAEARQLLTRMAPEVKVVTDERTRANYTIRKDRNGSSFRVIGGDARTPVRERATLDEAASVVARSMTAAKLLAMDNPSSTMGVRVWTKHVGGAVQDRNVGVMRPRRKQKAASPYCVYREGDDIGSDNCLQVFVEPDQDCYITVVNVDGAGRIGQLFPNELSEESGYLPDGFVTGGAPVAIPDGLDADASAGFLLPLLTAGDETIRVFATSDYELAARIRDAVQAAHALQKQGAGPGEVDAVLQSLREQMVSTAFRAREVGVMGVKVVKNKARKKKPAAEAAEPPLVASSLSGETLTGEEFDELAADWTAASVGFQVRAERGSK